MVNIETNTNPAIEEQSQTIDQVIGEVKSEMEAKAIAQTTVSMFWNKYMPEEPAKVKLLVHNVMQVMKGLQKAGYNMKQYCDRMVNIAISIQNKYDGENEFAVQESTMRVIDGAVYKSGTRYFKKEE
ncbi:hypothetical protein KY333_04320 [Candidatus Woesearchaeota archaeon]|nr:hypothetical protein [Candidatus Woesearchaeota archaeon]MBW2994122.1 hypothetical protein [Candidatus Woesearchaeota archaeon]